MKTIGTPALRSALHGLQRPCAWQVLTASFHEIERCAKETPEDMRLGMRQDLALPILESSSTGSWSNSAQTSEDTYAV